MHILGATDSDRAPAPAKGAINGSPSEEAQQQPEAPSVAAEQHSASSPATLPEDPLAEQPSTAAEPAPEFDAVSAEGGATEQPEAAVSDELLDATRPEVTLSLSDVWDFKRKQAVWALPA